MMNSPEAELISILGATDSGSDTSFFKPGSKALPDTLPILGLSDIVVFPGMVAPLLVESTSSIKLIDDVVAGDRFLGLILQKKADITDPKPEDLWGNGCAAKVLKMLKFPDNTVRILVEGVRRIKVLEYISHEPYLKAKVELIKETRDNSLEMTALARNTHQKFQEVVELSPTLSEQVKVAALNTEEAGKLADLVAVNLNLSLDERQKLLEMIPVKDRLTHLLPLLSRELEVLSISSKIQREVANSMSKSQREVFLREQMRAIQKELGEGDPATSEIAAFKEAVEKNQLPEDVKKVALKEIDRLQTMPPAMAEYTVSRNYLDWLVNLPWSKSTEDKINLKTAQKVLDAQHHGLGKVKDRLIEYLAVIKLNQKIKGPILCLVGPPGVGKTSLGKSVADALGRKFVRIALGGMRDEAEIRGHRRTYVSALPGRIIQGLRRIESNNPVVLLDELDKVGSDFRGDPAAALLEVLDPHQNHGFTDNYLELPFDLSKVLFITTANWLDPVHAALRDRLEVIDLPSYTLAEKLQIARKHLIPRQLHEHGLKPKFVKIPETIIRHLIQDYTLESGVRQLEREIASIARKAARQIADLEGPVEPMVITLPKLREWFGPPKHLDQTAEAITECGIAMGLAWTPFGGDILFIEATRVQGEGKLQLTGSLGDVMKESAQTALSFLRSQAGVLGIPSEEFKKHDLHVHVPAGATPKDGPSAGVTIVAALASLFTKRMLKSGLAMTGEISLRGRVLRVGGIKEKVLAAARSGIKELILPEQNRNDCEEIPADTRKKIKFHFVKRISQVIELALKP